MSRTYLSLGSVPSGEECAQVGCENFSDKSRIEVLALMFQVGRIMGDLPEGVALRGKDFPHDFGTYRELVVSYNDDDEKAVDWVIKCMGKVPEFWDEPALAYIKREADRFGLAWDEKGKAWS